MKAAGQPGRQADQQQRAQPADPRRMHDHYDAVMLVVACNLGLAGGLLHNGVTFALARGVFPVRSVLGWMLFVTARRPRPAALRSYGSYESLEGS